MQAAALVSADSSAAKDHQYQNPPETNLTTSKEKLTP
jgi:hypothetical protein